MNDFNNERIHFFTKYRSLTLYFRKGDVLLCVRDKWKQRQTALLTQVFLLSIVALLPHLGWGCSTVSHWGSKALSLQASSRFDIPVSTARLLRASCLYSFLTLTFFDSFTLVYLLIEGSVAGQYILFYLYFWTSWLRLHKSKARPNGFSVLFPVFEKSATKLNPQTKIT